jgi:hypothetical protein
VVLVDCPSESVTVPTRMLLTARPQRANVEPVVPCSSDQNVMTASDLATELDEILRFLGFRRRKLRWNRRSGAFIDIINLQESNAGDTITMNIGVMHTSIYRTVWGKDLPNVVDEPSSTVRARIGKLIDGKDLWWSFEVLPTREELDALCRIHVFPFMEQMHSVVAMEQYLMAAKVEKHPYPLPKLHLALLRLERGDKAAACGVLSEMKLTLTGSWLDRVNEVANRIGCACDSHGYQDAFPGALKK